MPGAQAWERRFQNPLSSLGCRATPGTEVGAGSPWPQDLGSVASSKHSRGCWERILSVQGIRVSFRQSSPPGAVTGGWALTLSVSDSRAPLLGVPEVQARG